MAKSQAAGRIVDITIKKVGERDGKERFILVNALTRKVLTVDDVPEEALRRYFRQQGAEDGLIDEALQTARRRYAEMTSAADARVDSAADTMDDEDDLLLDLGLDDGPDG
jgi:hypothetical protein